jgi:hypothetical protein
LRDHSHRALVVLLLAGFSGISARFWGGLLQFLAAKPFFSIPDPMRGIQRTRADVFLGLIGEHMSKYTGPIEPILLNVTQVARMIGLPRNPSEWMPWNYRETLTRLATPAAA